MLKNLDRLSVFRQIRMLIGRMVNDESPGPEADLVSASREERQLATSLFFGAHAGLRQHPSLNK
jgi:hypothetical protein